MNKEWRVEKKSKKSINVEGGFFFQNQKRDFTFIREMRVPNIEQIISRWIQPNTALDTLVQELILYTWSFSSLIYYSGGPQKLLCISLALEFDKYTTL